MSSEIRVAFSHDWLNGMRGGEKCLEALCELYAGSPIYTLFYEKGKVSDTIARHPIHTSRLQAFPGVFTHYRNYLPFFARSMEAFELPDVDMLVSLSHCVAKGVRKKPGTVHVCYCFTPVRYAWGLFDEYFGGKNFVLKRIIRLFVDRLRRWDLRSNDRVDHFVAISNHVKDRIGRFYRRQARVIYPPVDTAFFSPDPEVKREDFYLVVSALVPYKRVGVAVEAFNRMGRRLVVIGEGPEKKALMRLGGKSIEFLGWKSDELLRDYYRRARALVFPGEEDFGIVPVEMQACGGFVIACRKGGALETVSEDRTGVFFDGDSPESLERAVRRFESLELEPAESVANAARFARERFKSEMREYLEEICGRAPAGIKR